MSKLTFHNFSSIKESKEFVYANFSYPKSFWQSGKLQNLDLEL